MTNLDMKVTPYVGPRPFQNEDGEWFFGRSREARELTAIVISKRLVLFYAQSGAGKTSLINTKLVPGLENENFEVLVGRVGSGAEGPQARPKNIYVYNLMLNLIDKRESVDIASLADLSLAEFLNFLNRKQNSQGKYRYFYDETYAPAEILPRTLIIDQFEEVLTTHPEAWLEREDFFQQLRQAIEEDPYLGVVLSIREDYVGRLDYYAPLLPDKLRNRYYMARMNKRAAKRAIMSPASRAVKEYKVGRQFEPETAEQLVRHLSYIKTESQATGSEVEGPDVEPVQLQVICQHIWNNLKDNGSDPITLHDIRNLTEDGNLKHLIDNSLSSFYEESLRQIRRKSDFTISEVDLRDWFNKNLITESETRGMVYRGESHTAGLDNQVIDFLVSEAYLLREETRAGGTWYELTHDRFIEPILQSNQDWLANQPLIKLAQRWAAADEDRKADLLLGSKQLAIFKETNYQALGDLAVEFIEASEADQERKRDIHIAREAEQKEREQKLMAERAEEANKRALAAEQLVREQKKVKNLAFIIAFILTLMFIGAIIFSFVTWGNLQDKASAVDNAEAALAAEEAAKIEALAANITAKTALVAEEAAKVEAQQALVEKTKAELQRDALKLANDVLQGKVLDPDLQVLLATLAISKTRLLPNTIVPEAEQALRQVIWARHFEEQIEVTELLHNDSVIDVKFHPDGQRLVSISSDETVKIWDVNSDNELATFDTNYSGRDQFTVLPVALNKHGDYLAAPTGAGKTVTIWKIDTGEEVVSLSDKETNRIWSLAFGGNRDQYLAVGDYKAEEGQDLAKGQIVIWDLDSEKVLHRFSGHQDGVSGLAFNPDSSLLASASKDATVRLWDVVKRTPIYTLTAHSAWVNRVAFSPDGSQLASAADDGTIKVFDTETGGLVQSLEAAGKYVRDLDFIQTSIGQLYLAGVDGGDGSFGTVKFWQWQVQDMKWELQGELPTLENDRPIVWNIDFAPTGKYLGTANSDGSVRLLPLPSDDINVLYNQACQHTKRNFSYEELLDYQTEISGGPNASQEEVLLSTIVCPYPPDPSILAHLIDEGETNAELEAFLRETYKRIGEDFDQTQADRRIAGAKLALVNRDINIKDFPAAWDKLIELEEQENDQQLDQLFTIALTETYQEICIVADSEFEFKRDACTKTLALLSQAGQDIEPETRATLAALYLKSCISSEATDSGMGIVDAPCQQASELAREIKSDADKISDQLHINLGDVYAFEISEPNTTVRIGMDAADNFETRINPWLYVYNLEGDLLVENDDGQGTLNSLIPRYTFTETGQYLIHATAIDGRAGQYELTFKKERQKPVAINQSASGNTADFTRWVFPNNEVPHSVALTITYSQTVQALTPKLTDLAGGQVFKLNDMEAPSETHLMVFTRQGEQGFSIEDASNSDPISYTLRLTDLTPRLISYNTVTSSNTQQQPLWQFEGQAGDQVSISMVGDDAEIDPIVRLYEPDGEVPFVNDNAAEGIPHARILAYELPRDGTYLIHTDSSNGQHGPYSLRLTQHKPQTVTLNSTSDGEIAQDRTWIFENDQPQIVQIATQPDTASHAPKFSLARPDGQELGNVSSNKLLYLPLVGPYTVQLQPEDIISGSYQLSLTPLTSAGLIEPGEPQNGQLEAGGMELWRFSGEQLEAVIISMTSSLTETGVTLYSPAGDQISTGRPSSRISVSMVAVTPISGTYLIAIQVSDAAAAGPYTLTLAETDLPPGQPLGEPLTGHAQWVNAVAFSPDGRQIASGSDDTMVRLWDAATGEEIMVLGGHTG